MAFTNNMDIREALDRCATEAEWENFTSSVQIPPELIPYAMQRYADLALGSNVFCIVSKMMVL